MGPLELFFVFLKSAALGLGGYGSLPILREDLILAGHATDDDLETAISLMIKHRALEDTIKRARHYGSIAKDALALFPASPMKEALVEAVDFAIGRSS